MATQRRSKKPSLGILFWIAVILLIVAIFLSNRGNIQQALERSGLRQIIAERSIRRGDATDDAIEIVEEPADPTPEEGNATQELPSTEIPLIVAPNKGVQSPEPTPSDGAVIPKRREAGSNPDIVLQETAIYFISLEQDSIVPVHVRRKVRKEAPMTHTLQWLIKGPTTEESEQGLLNLIPPNSRLLSASIKNGIAYINFNEDFRYNNFGAEGTLAQLQQVVFSVTEYSTIQQVQILINGKRVDYLQSESPIYIGQPIGREIFG